MLACQGNLSRGNLSVGELVRGALVRGELVGSLYPIQVYIQENVHSWPDIFPNPAPEGRTETLQLTYIPEMLAVYIQYQYIYITKCQLSLLIGIGYILPTFGEYTSFGGFLCALRAQGWGIFLVRNVHFLICIHTCIRYKLPTFGEYMLVGGFVCAGLGIPNGEYVWSGMYIFLYVYLYWI